MALKDWHKVKTRRGLIKYQDNYGRWIYLSESRNLKGEKMYGVDSNDPNYYASMRFFKKRSEAISFMKKYMRTH